MFECRRKLTPLFSQMWRRSPAIPSLTSIMALACRSDPINAPSLTRGVGRSRRDRARSAYELSVIF